MAILKWIILIHQLLALLTLLHLLEFGLLSAQDLLPTLLAIPSFICTVTDEPRSVSPFWFSLPTQCPAKPTNSVLFEPSPISSPTDEMQTLTALLPSFHSEAWGIYIAYIKIVFPERSDPLWCRVPLFLLHVLKRLPPLPLCVVV